MNFPLWFSVRRLFVAAAIWLAVDAGRAVGGEISSPSEFLGHEVGADYQLARWETIADYFRHLDANSDRIQVRQLGLSTEGLPVLLAEISSEKTVGDLATHRERQRKLADPRLQRDGEEPALIAESKVVVLVNCNLHSIEVAASQMAMELAYELATSQSDRVREILERTIILLVPSANPDGLNKVIDWYQRTIGKPWEGSGMPWLYQKYAGHDNNRDWFMLNLQETRLLTRVLYEEWFPTIVYDVHQMGNRTARFFVPPFHDPKNPNVHPLIDQALLLIGGHMASELAREGKQGVVHGAMYDNWWAGGFRTTPYRHNMVGILTEAASPRIASPVFQQKEEFRPVRGLPSYALATNFPEPWPGGWWRLRDVVEYEKIACMSLFTLASRYHDMFQENYVRMAREAIDRGKTEPPFAWLVPADQRDIGSAIKMLRILRATGVEVHRAQEDFTADGVPYPSGTFILYCGQPYRAHLNDMMERQKYPDRVQYPGGPAEPPYDIAGWTLPLQMGVRHVPVATEFMAKAERLDEIDLPPSTITGPDDAAAYVLEIGRNADYPWINRLHRAGIAMKVWRPERSGNAGTRREGKHADGFVAGTILIPDGAKLRSKLPSLTKGLHVQLRGLEKPHADRETDGERGAASAQAGSAFGKGAFVELRPPRTGLYQPWTASMDEGWTRWVLDAFEFDYASVHNAEIRAGNLRSRYDCLVLPSLSTTSILEGRPPDSTEPAYVGGIGSEGVVHLQAFVRAGGTLVCIDQSSNLPIEYFNLPVTNVVEHAKTQDFFCPGSLLRVAIDPEHPIAWGLPEWISGYFARSQAFELLQPNERHAAARHPANRFPTTTVARYGDTVLLESGWIRGAERIADKPAIVEVQYGEGRIVLLGFRVQHRGQPHGTFRILFNAIQSSAM